MMKKKLKINNFKVKSFVTDLEEAKSETVKGGVLPNSIAPTTCGGYGCQGSPTILDWC